MLFLDLTHITCWDKFKNSIASLVTCAIKLLRYLNQNLSSNKTIWSDFHGTIKFWNNLKNLPKTLLSSTRQANQGWRQASFSPFLTNWQLFSICRFKAPLSLTLHPLHQLSTTNLWKIVLEFDCAALDRYWCSEMYQRMSTQDFDDLRSIGGGRRARNWDIQPQVTEDAFLPSENWHNTTHRARSETR